MHPSVLTLAVVLIHGMTQSEGSRFLPWDTSTLECSSHRCTAPIRLRGAANLDLRNCMKMPCCLGKARALEYKKGLGRATRPRAEKLSCPPQQPCSPKGWKA